jgi:hypothetical protein
MCDCPDVAKRAGRVPGTEMKNLHVQPGPQCYLCELARCVIVEAEMRTGTYSFQLAVAIIERKLAGDLGVADENRCTGTSGRPGPGGANGTDIGP